MYNQGLAHSKSIQALVETVHMGRIMHVCVPSNRPALYSRLVGIGIVLAHLQKGVLQLHAYRCA